MLIRWRVQGIPLITYPFSWLDNFLFRFIGLALLFKKLMNLGFSCTDPFVKFGKGRLRTKPDYGRRLYRIILGAIKCNLSL